MKTRFLISALLLLCLALPSFAQQTMPMGAYGRLPVRTENVAADTATLVPGQMATLLTVTPVSASTLTTPTATLLCRLFPFVAASGDNNFSWDWYVKNTGADADAVTIQGGSGVTVVGTATIAQNAVKHFLISLTSCGASPSAKVISLGSSTF